MVWFNCQYDITHLPYQQRHQWQPTAISHNRGQYHSPIFLAILHFQPCCHEDDMEAPAAGGSITQPLANAIPDFLPVFLIPNSSAQYRQHDEASMVMVTMNHLTTVNSKHYWRYSCQPRDLLKMLLSASRFVGMLLCPILHLFQGN